MSREAKQRKSLRRRERDFRERRAAKTYLTPKASLARRGVISLSYDISFEPIKQDDPATARFTQEIGEEWISELHGRLYDEPENAVPDLEALVERYPDVPMLYNWLGAAYEASGKSAKATRLTRLNFERNPDYLFAKTAICEILLHEGDVQEVTRILDKQFDLKLMYPHRDLFHFTELLALQHLLVHYFMKLDNRDQARIHLKMMHDLAPEHRFTTDARLLIGRSEIMRRFSLFT